MITWIHCMYLRVCDGGIKLKYIYRRSLQLSIRWLLHCHEAIIKTVLKVWSCIFVDYIFTTHKTWGNIFKNKITIVCRIISCSKVRAIEMQKCYAQLDVILHPTKSRNIRHTAHWVGQRWGHYVLWSSWLNRYLPWRWPEMSGDVLMWTDNTDNWHTYCQLSVGFLNFCHVVWEYMV